VPDPIPEETLRSALLYAKRFATHHPGVVGADFGLLFEGPHRRVRGEGIRFHVCHKKHPSLVPVSEELPKEILGIRCDVLQASYQTHASPKDRHNPIRPGISIGNRSFLTAGTLGCFVRDRLSGATCLLSNWHVLYGDRAALVGAPIVQPAARNLQDNTAPTVATLLATVFTSDNVDAAIARLTEGVELDQQTFETGHVASTVAEPRTGMKVVKFGVVSETTHALVDGVDGHYRLDYPNPQNGLPEPIWVPGFHLVRHPNHPELEISRRGDSGAVWFDADTGAAVGLHFAGEDNLAPTAEFALAHPMSQVLKLLDVELLP
jgi:hypothetical protein